MSWYKENINCKVLLTFKHLLLPAQSGSNSSVWPHLPHIPTVCIIYGVGGKRSWKQWFLIPIPKWHTLSNHDTSGWKIKYNSENYNEKIFKSICHKTYRGKKRMLECFTPAKFHMSMKDLPGYYTDWKYPPKADVLKPWLTESLGGTLGKWLYWSILH